MLDGSSIEGFVRIEESDQYLWPDLDSFAVLPWRPQYGKVARLICDVYNPDGAPFPGDPRNVLKRAVKRASDLGFTFNVGPELEFFLFQTDDEGNPTTATADQAGYFDLGPLDHGEGTRREICLTLEEMGFEIEASHHEVSAGQHVETLSLLYYPGMPLEHALDRLFVNCDRAYRHGANILILSDRGVDENHMEIAPASSAKGRDVVVIGTGDTASDCVATALRQGCNSVTQLVRRPRKDYLDVNGNLSTDYAHEEAVAISSADPRRFGVQVQSLATGEDGALTGVVTTEGDTLPCQLLVGATGFSGCAENVCKAFGVEKDKTVLTEKGRFCTNVEKVFAAGDMRRGASLVVWAIAEGRAAAAEVDRFLIGYTNLVGNV